MRDGWWTIHPESGEPVRVLPAEMVEQARHKAWEHDIKIGVLCEAAARLLVVYRRSAHNWTEEEAADARRELRDGLQWIARGGVEPPVASASKETRQP